MLAEKFAEVSEHVPTIARHLREITEHLAVLRALTARSAPRRRQSGECN
jgi:hypothetical protein